MPPKVRNFIWRVCAECLPTLVNLRFKHVPINTLYFDCQREHKDEMHVLFICPLAANSRAL